MFAPLEGTIDHQLERRREARRIKARSLSREKARIDQQLTALSREAGDEGDWKAAGCSSGAQWLAQIIHSEHSTALQIVDAGIALEALPALDEALSTGAMTLDQASAAARFATPATDAKLALIGIDMAPRQLARVARSLSPPTLADDAELRARRALSMNWIEGGRELAIKGRLPLEQGAAFEQAIRRTAEAQRAADKKRGGDALTWQQSTADALVALTTGNGNGNAHETRDGEGRVHVERSNVTVIVHLSPDEPPFIEGGGTISPETAARLACGARSMVIQPHGRDLRHSRIGRCASYPQLRAMVKRSKHCQYPGCTSTYNMQSHHLLEAADGGLTLTAEMILLCSHHHKHLHDHHIQTTGTGRAPVFTSHAGRPLTSDRPHAPPG